MHNKDSFENVVLSVMEFYGLEEADHILHSKFSSRLLEQILEHFQVLQLQFYERGPIQEKRIQLGCGLMTVRYNLSRTCESVC